MKTSEAGVAFIAAHEGIVTRAYRDAAGVWTIGIGHTAAAGAPVPKAGMTITRAEAFAILAADLPKYERRVDAALAAVQQHVFDGAVSFDFNTGAIHRASWVAAFRTGDMAEMRKGLTLWTKAGGRVLRGLERRRAAEADLIADGWYGAPKEAGDDIRALQRDLAALGFHRGAIDGIAGPITRAAVRAYQAQHPDLVVDGIAGPATRASIARDLAARRAAETVGGVVAGTIAAGIPAAITGEGIFLALVGVVAVAATIAVGVFVYRYRGEVSRMFRKGV